MKVNVIILIIYILIIFSISLSITFFQNELLYILSIIFPGLHCCGFELFLPHITIVPLISLIFSSILNDMKKPILLPIIMSTIVLLSMVMGNVFCIVNDRSTDWNITFFVYLTVPTFVLSTLGVTIGRLISLLYHSVRENLKNM